VATRRALLFGVGPFVCCAAPLVAWAQSGVWPEWQGHYAGSLQFYRSIPLEDIYPPPAHPHVDRENSASFGIYFSIDVDQGLPSVWLRIDGGPMQTSEQGEILRFSRLVAGMASLIGVQGRPNPRSATLTVRPDSLGTEALFNFADGSFWRRHFNVRFTPSGADVIVWVFDAEGTRARTWRGSALRQQP
jgi:hypothetical protein